MQRKLEHGTITVPVPDHREIRQGTLLSVIRQSGVPRTEFEQGKERERRRPDDGERGYVLIVLMLTAALLFIALSRVIPQAAFEGRREREEETIFRGLQYHRAVQMFFRKFGRYPNSVDELVKTSNLRFLRKRYADPLTKEGEWRLVHVGPNGAFVDAQTSPLAAPRTLAAGQQSGNPSQPGSGSATPSTAQPGAQTAQQGFQSAFGQNPGQPAMGLSPISSGAANPGAMPPGFPPQPGAVGKSTEPALSPSANPGANPLVQPGGSVLGQQPRGSSTAGTAPPTTGGAQPSFTFSNQPTLGGMAIAGFASQAAGPSIRSWNGYDEYSKWEFIYDFRQDQLAMAKFAAQNPPGAPVPPGTQPGGQVQPGTQPGFQPGFQPAPGVPPFLPPGATGPVQQPGFQPRPGVPPFAPPGMTGPGTPPSPFSPTPGALPPPRTR